MEKRTLTIEEMIVAGASWADISTRVKEMQREHEAKKKAEEAAAKAKAKKRERLRQLLERDLLQHSLIGVSQKAL